MNNDVNKRFYPSATKNPIATKKWIGVHLLAGIVFAILMTVVIVAWFLVKNAIVSQDIDRLPEFLLAGGIFVSVIVAAIMHQVLKPYVKIWKNQREEINTLYQGEERYELVIQGANDGFWDWDVKTGKVLFSSRWRGMLGYSIDDSVGSITFWHERVHPEDVNAVRQAVAYYFEGRIPHYTSEYRIRRKNGEYIWVLDRGKVVRDNSGKPTRMAGSTTDVDSIHRVEEVLKSRTLDLQEAKSRIEAENREVMKFKRAVDSSMEAVTITSPEGSIIYVNSAWEDLNGYTFDEVEFVNPSILKCEKTPPFLFEEMWKNLLKGKTFTSEEIINKRKDGSEFQAAISIFPIRENDKNIFYVSLMQDITHRKAVEKAKTEFVSLASHQLRTPLSAIRWYSEMLLSKYTGELTEKQRSYLNEIYQGNLRMVELVNALLNVSRIDLGTFAIDPEPADLTVIMDSVLNELKPQIIQRKLIIEKVYDPKVPIMEVDPKLTRVIFQNLLSNAVKYTDEGGKITAEIRRQNPYVYIRIADNGYGIPKSQHDKIFEKLFRADNVRQKDTEGTGLGLYIVRAIIKESSGKIWFDSEENKGTTFHVLLPISGMKKKMGTRGIT